jgi:peptide/nickel transport system substrate-binding protein
MSDWDDLKAAAFAGLLDRRSFLLRSAALGASAAMIGGVLPKAAFAAANPTTGGTLRIGAGGGSTTDSVDPQTYTDSVNRLLGYQLFNGLIEIDDKQKATPELLESWEVKPGAKEWTFNVRQGVTFHNGKTLTVEDVIYSINLHRGKSKSAMNGPLQIIADVKKLSDKQLQIVLNSGDADFLYTLGDYHLLVVPDGFTDWAKPIGTGGFVFESYEPGVRAVTNRNKNYWKQGRAHVDRVELTVVNDSASRMNALISGQVDVINRVDKKAVDLLKSAPGIELVQAPGGWHPILAAQVDKAPLDNLDIRLALKYAIDREQVLKTLFNGYGSLGNDHPVPKGDPFVNTDLPQRPYDPDKAAFHFKKAAANGQIVISASDASFNGAVDMALLYQATAAKAGVPIQVKKEPADGFWDNVWLKAPFATSYWSGRPAATQMISIAYKSDAAWNETHWRRESFDKLLVSAQSETDEAKRKGYIFELQKVLYDEGGAIIPVFSDFLDAHTAAVKGHTPHSNFDMCNERVAEKVWLES